MKSSPSQTTAAPPVRNPGQVQQLSGMEICHYHAPCNLCQTVQTTLSEFYPELANEQCPISTWTTEPAKGIVLA